MKRPLAKDFACDADHVYWEGQVVHGVAPDGFVVLGEHFAHDAERVYYFYSGIHRSVNGEVVPRVLVDADPRTFVALGELYGKDAARVYWHGTQFVADAASFETLDAAFARTATHVYFEGEVVEGADAGSFELIGNWGHARDATSVFQVHVSDHGNWVTRVDGADPDAFEVIGGAYTKRGGIIFAGDQPIDADAASFVLLADGYARDRTRAYFHAQVVTEGPLEIVGEGFARTAQRVYLFGTPVEGADPATFRRIDFAYVADANRVWLRIGEEGEDLRELVGADPATFSVRAGGVCSTATRVWHVDREIVGADPESFELLSNEYARDAQHVFADGRIVEGADPRTFVIMTPTYAKDAQRVYVEGAAIAADVETFAPIGWSGYASDRHRVYRGLDVVDGDPATFVPPPLPDDIPF